MISARTLFSKIGRCLLSALAAAMIGQVVQAAPAAKPPAGFELERVVMLTRHGVRPPTSDLPLPQGYAAEAWPTWDVPAGHLTAHGAALISQLGGYDRLQYAQRGLVSMDRCPGAGTVVVWSDTDQRTTKSAEAWVKGFAPGCDLQAERLAGGRDPLYSPLRVKRVAYDPAAAAADALAHVGGDIDGVARAHSDLLNLAQSALHCCWVPLCHDKGLADHCVLQDIPNQVTGGDGDHAHLEGPMAIGSTAAEDFMLEYAEGMPMSQVGWGRISRADLPKVLALHALEYRIVSRTPYVAARAGAPLARRILSALNGTSDLGSKVVIFMGHDDNIAALSGLLDLHWAPQDYPADDPSPGFTLGFELLKNIKTGERYVQPFFQMQSLDQMRNLSPLSLSTPPIRQLLAFPLCAAARGQMCRLQSFQKLVETCAVKLL